MAAMEERGISLLYGRWLIEGAPRVLLIDTSTGYRWLDEWKGDLWSAAGIPSPAGDSETNEAIVFGYLVAWFLGEVSCKMTLFDKAETDATSLLPKSKLEQ
jgi:glycogen synthase